MAIWALTRWPDGNSLYSELRGRTHSEQMAITFLSVCLLNMWFKQLSSLSKGILLFSTMVTKQADNRKRDKRLNRTVLCLMRAGFNILHLPQDHGWRNHLELLIFLYWPAHGVSHKITVQVFDVPRSTVSLFIQVQQTLERTTLRLYFLSNFNKVAEVGQGFQDWHKLCLQRSCGSCGRHIKNPNTSISSTLLHG